METKQSKLIVPKNYKSSLSIRETETTIKLIKDFFERQLAEALNLYRVSAPLFVKPETGLNDDLNGVEKPVSFEIRDICACRAEIVHSLAKWKRVALNRYGFSIGEGIYTDMNAIRKEEELDNLHSIYVDQWDWEKIISKEQRNIHTLKDTVRKIYSALKKIEEYVVKFHPQIKPELPEEIAFITTQELEDMYPDLDSKQREDMIAKDKKAVFIIGIGGELKSGQKHDGRAPDYDDWELNGDIILWYPILNKAIEISSMGIRVDEEALIKQLKAAGCEQRIEMQYHKDLINGDLPYTMGGGIGQSRLCMFILKKAHIGEVQSSIWSDSMIKECEKVNITLL